MYPSFARTIQCNLFFPRDIPNKFREIYWNLIHNQRFINPKKRERSQSTSRIIAYMAGRGRSGSKWNKVCENLTLAHWYQLRSLEHLEIIDPAVEQETNSPLCSATSNLYPKNMNKYKDTAINVHPVGVKKEVNCHVFVQICPSCIFSPKSWKMGALYNTVHTWEVGGGECMI